MWQVTKVALKKAVEEIVGVVQWVQQNAEEVAVLTEDCLMTLTREMSWFAGVLKELAENVPPATRKALEALARRGWYLDFDMTPGDLWHLAEMLEAGDFEKAESELCDNFEIRAKEMEKELITAFPRRVAPLREAFEAHRQGWYYLAIPVFLGQADGICQDIAGIQLYSRDKKLKKPKTASLLEQVSPGPNSVTACLMYPLEIILPMVLSSSERGRDFQGLNRHQILHGESVDYGTRTNSLKTISHLYYTASILKLMKKS